MRKRLVRGAVVISVLAGLVMGWGCRRGDGPHTVPATGMVTFKGQPVEGALISFSPKTAELRSAIGTTNSAGRFQMMTLYPGDGAMPGSYTVTISKPLGITDAPPKDESVEAKVERSKKAVPFNVLDPATRPEPVSLLPAKYKDPATSGFTAEVKEQGSNEFTFALTE